MGPFIGREVPEPGKRIPGAPSTSQPKGKATNEDVNDVKELTEGVYAAFAGITGFRGWEISEPEAEAIAKPAARILARHKTAQTLVREVADPVALVVAIGIPTAARWALWQQWIKLSAEAQARATAEAAQRQAAPGPVPNNAPPNNGAATPDSISRIQNAF